MHYRTLANTDLKMSAIGLGGWNFGGGYDWGPITQENVCSVIDRALDQGINVIDTAPVYGASEEFLGYALQKKREQVILSTKCGLVKDSSWTVHDLRSQTISRQLEASLAKLKTDVIDLYFIHYLDPNIPWQDVLESLVRFKEQGKIRYIGVCNIPPAILADMAQTGQISCVQDELSLLHPVKGKAILKVCQTYGLGFMSYGSLCGGILSGKYTREPNFRRADARNYFYKCYRGENFAQAQHTVDQIKQMAQEKHVAPAQVALAWVLAQPGVTCALAGARSAEQVQQNATAANISLSAEELCNLAK